MSTDSSVYLCVCVFFSFWAWDRTHGSKWLLVYEFCLYFSHPRRWNHSRFSFLIVLFNHQMALFLWFFVFFLFFHQKEKKTNKKKAYSIKKSAVLYIEISDHFLQLYQFRQKHKMLFVYHSDVRIITDIISDTKRSRIQTKET